MGGVKNRVQKHEKVKTRVVPGKLLAEVNADTGLSVPVTFPRQGDGCSVHFANALGRGKWDDTLEPTGISVEIDGKIVHAIRWLQGPSSEVNHRYMQ